MKGYKSGMLQIRIVKGKEKRLRGGYPWVARADIVAASDQLLAEAGEMCEISDLRGDFLGIGTFNTQAPIPCRLLSRKREVIDTGWFVAKLAAALHRREKHILVPYYRLVHSEADGLPGLVIDRYGDKWVAQVSTAGMQRLWPYVLEALQQLFSPKAILLRNDIAARASEGLPVAVEIVRGEVPPLVEVLENGCVYWADLLHGQKTGWFYDQRENRALIASYAAGKTVLDAYCHSGGFGVLAAKAGATQVTMLDSSARALELAEKAATRNEVEARCATLRGDALACMQTLAGQGKQFAIVLADPPAYVKSHKDIESGMKGYTKIAKAAAVLASPGGMFKIASCSHHASLSRFKNAVLQGIAQAGRRAELINATAAACDHPVHPQLPQSGYLKALVFQLD